MKLLILSGTSEGRALARAVTKHLPDITVISSFAGVTHKTPHCDGVIRIGGFGGVAGLESYLKTQSIDVIIDATHPFAATITDHAFQASQRTNTAYLRLNRPQWVLPENTDVVFVPDVAEAARLVARTSKSVFLTIGSKDLSAFQNLGNLKIVVRAINDPNTNLGPDIGDTVITIQARPPFSLADEISLMKTHQIDTLVTKASGGEATRAKIDAAANVGARIVLIRRPPMPDCHCVCHVDEAMAWLQDL